MSDLATESSSSCLPLKTEPNMETNIATAALADKASTALAPSCHIDLTLNPETPPPPPVPSATTATVPLAKPLVTARAPSQQQQQQQQHFVAVISQPQQQHQFQQVRPKPIQPAFKQQGPNQALTSISASGTANAAAPVAASARPIAPLQHHGQLKAIAPHTGSRQQQQQQQQHQPYHHPPPPHQTQASQPNSTAAAQLHHQHPHNQMQTAGFCFPTGPMMMVYPQSIMVQSAPLAIHTSQGFVAASFAPGPPPSSASASTTTGIVASSASGAVVCSSTSSAAIASIAGTAAVVTPHSSMSAAHQSAAAIATSSSSTIQPVSSFGAAVLTTTTTSSASAARQHSSSETEEQKQKQQQQQQQHQQRLFDLNLRPQESALILQRLGGPAAVATQPAAAVLSAPPLPSNSSSPIKSHTAVTPAAALVPPLPPPPPIQPPVPPASAPIAPPSSKPQQEKPQQQQQEKQQQSKIIPTNVSANTECENQPEQSDSKPKQPVEQTMPQSQCQQLQCIENQQVVAESPDNSAADEGKLSCSPAVVSVSESVTQVASTAADSQVSNNGTASAVVAANGGAVTTSINNSNSCSNNEPRIIKHLIDGFVVLESNQPFPVKRPYPEVNGCAAATYGPSFKVLKATGGISKSVNLDGEEVEQPTYVTLNSVGALMCEFCGKFKPFQTFKASRRFCSVSCARKYNVSKKVEKQRLKREAPAPQNPDTDQLSHRALQPKQAKVEPQDEQQQQSLDSSVKEQQQQKPDDIADAVDGNASCNEASGLLDQFYQADNENDNNINNATDVRDSQRDVEQLQEQQQPQEDADEDATVAQDDSLGDHDRVDLDPCGQAQAALEPEKAPQQSSASESVEPQRPARPEVLNWSVSDVHQLVASTPGCAPFAVNFRLQEIDGEALLLLKEENLMRPPLSMKLGPALKLSARIEEARATVPPDFFA
ncbi:hypothetical protein BOX15_Mlig032614g3 [Macrostomum lignano]|uniref:FCS-type domain-containing protein n=1 Tax=Macrostomum lignano TaxID=282301 RepID=A0A267GZL0_9PLAT|nr:hypothetical protein BOX15_Mlig032614g3 [Macrostomum lignano]